MNPAKFIKGIHRALVMILDDPPRFSSETSASDIGEGKADPGEATALFGIWKDNPAVDSVNSYLDGLRRERF